MGVEAAPTSKELEERLQHLNNYFTYSLYENICRSLFERHKLLFSFLLTQRILQGNKDINMDEWRYLLAGPAGEIEVPKTPVEWISETAWPDIYRNIYGAATTLPAFSGFQDYFIANIDKF
jgi:dynein heavy chain